MGATGLAGEGSKLLVPIGRTLYKSRPVTDSETWNRRCIELNGYGGSATEEERVCRLIIGSVFGRCQAKHRASRFQFGIVSRIDVNDRPTP